MDPLLDYFIDEIDTCINEIVINEENILPHYNANISYMDDKICEIITNEEIDETDNETDSSEESFGTDKASYSSFPNSKIQSLNISNEDNYIVDEIAETDQETHMVYDRIVSDERSIRIDQKRINCISTDLSPKEGFISNEKFDICTEWNNNRRDYLVHNKFNNIARIHLACSINNFEKNGENAKNGINDSINDMDDEIVINRNNLKNGNDYNICIKKHTFEPHSYFIEGYESGGSESTLAMTNSEGNSFNFDKFVIPITLAENQEQLKDISNNIALRPRRSITIKSKIPEECLEIKKIKPQPVKKTTNDIIPENNEVPDEYYEGRLLWGKLKSYPWWPCMIYRSPEKIFYKISKHNHLIHVVYFGPRVERGWINVNDIFSYDGKDKFDELVKKLRDSNASAKDLKDYCYPSSRVPFWTDAWKEAEMALFKKLRQRIRNHGIMYKDSKGQCTVSDIDESEDDEYQDVAFNNLSVSKTPESSKETSQHTTPEKMDENGSIGSKHSDKSMNDVMTQNFDDNISVHSNHCTHDIVPMKVFDQELEDVNDNMSTVSIHSNHKKVVKNRKHFEDNFSIHSNKSANSFVPIQRTRRERPKKINISKAKDNDSISVTSSHITIKETKKLEPNKLFFEYLNLQAPSFGGKRTSICLLCLSELDYTINPVVSCGGLCSQTFHVSCMTLLLDYVTSKDPEKPILNYNKCVDCNRNQRRCFMCRKLMTDCKTKDIVKCSHSQCGRYYHSVCLDNGIYRNLVTHNRHGSVTCPSHTCHSCHLDNPATVRHCNTHVRCVMCPASFHKGDWCIPAGSKEIDSFNIICPQHLKMGGSYDMSIAPFTNCVKNGTVTLDKYRFQVTSFADNEKADLWILNKPPKSIKSKPSNVTWCFICSKGGDLICCEKCPASLHQHCAKVDEIPESFVCDECEMGKYPRYGEIFWLKIGNYRWWPAQIIHPKNAPKNVLSSPHGDGQFLVLFFGTNDYHWCNKTQAFMFDEGDDESSDTNDNSSSDENVNNKVIPNDHSKRNLEIAYQTSLKNAGRAYRRRFKKWCDLMIDGKKPTHYRTIKNNVPIGNVRINKVQDISEIHQCECRPNVGNNDQDPCGSSSDCINRQLNYECNPSYCRNGAKCRNQRFMLRQYPRLEVFNTTDRGWALRANESIKQGAFVIEYVGEVIDEEESNRRLKTAHENNVANFYMMELDGQRIIDAGPAANISRFMNHSCSPNVFTQRWFVNGDIRVGIFALHDIKTNEELTFNYNFLSLGEMKIPCKCGASNCSGFLGVPPKLQSSSPELLSVDNQETQSHKTKIIKKTTVKAVTERRAVKTKRRNDDSAPPNKKQKPLCDKHCFVCRGKRCNLHCGCDECPRSYHSRCLELSELPDGDWWCPWHFCDDCGKMADTMCSFCTVSFCSMDLADRVLQCPDSGPMACIDHYNMYVALHKNTQGTTMTNNNNTIVTNNSITTIASAPSSASSSLDNTGTESPPSISI